MPFSLWISVKLAQQIWTKLGNYLGCFFWTPLISTRNWRIRKPIIQIKQQTHCLYQEQIYSSTSLLQCTRTIPMMISRTHWLCVYSKLFFFKMSGEANNVYSPNVFNLYLTLSATSHKNFEVVSGNLLGPAIWKIQRIRESMGWNTFS